MRVIVRSISTLILCFPFVITAVHAAEDEWYTYRHDSARTGAQPVASDFPIRRRSGHSSSNGRGRPGVSSVKESAHSRHRPSSSTTRSSSAIPTGISTPSTPRPARSNGNTLKTETTL
jgi:hypothetical protein